jgi:NAD(P)-dependent dehydrogenase (short-subunit alcohol dehydrogenase family)
MASTNINTLFSVRGRIALVTGGTSGIGLMIAKGLITNGCKVYICGLSDPEPAEEFASQSGGHVIIFHCDLSSEAGIQQAANFVRERETHLDILISNAGVRRDATVSCDPLTASLGELQTSLLSHTYESWIESFQINTMAHFYLSVSLLDLLAAAGERVLEDGSRGRENGCGVVVVTSSIASLHNATNVDMMSYATTKAATDHLVALLAAKFSRWYVRVVGINPGCRSSLFTIYWASLWVRGS